jgi:hypothetical protein
VKPKFTDQYKYPNGYTRSEGTDITKTFERIRREQKKQAEALQHKLISIGRVKANGR